jgi:hypothetical protein
MIDFSSQLAQVVTDVRLWMRDEMKELKGHLRNLISTTVERAERLVSPLTLCLVVVNNFATVLKNNCVASFLLASSPPKNLKG